MSEQKKMSPPAWPKRFFEWYCGPDIAEDLTGDMDELFYQNIKKTGLFKARFKYCLQALSLIFSHAVRKRKHQYRQRYGSNTYHSMAMYRSYAKIAFRSLAKQKTFSVINIICLSVGMSVGLLALAAFVDVLEVDNFQKNADRIYRVTSTIDDASAKRTYAISPAPLAEKLKTDIAGIEAIVQANRGFNVEVMQSANTSVPLQGYFVSANFCNVFSFPLVEGNPAHALEKPFSILITQSAAKKLFGYGQAVGKALTVKGLGEFEVTGVVADYARSHFYFEILTPYSTLAILEQQHKLKPSLHDWDPLSGHYTYALLHPGTSPSQLSTTLEKIGRSAYDPKTLPHVTFGLQALTDIPLSELYREIGPSWGYIPMVIFFSLALLVLLPACFNYSNIAIARALKRAREIGLRKVSGGQSGHVFFQMIMETIILSMISLVGAMVLFYIIREAFIDMVVNGSRTFDLEVTPLTFIVFLVFGVFTGFLAGVFPASYFARLNPIQTLRNTSQSGKLSKISIRKGLIVMQFALSLVFILGVAIIVKQYRYALNYDLGFRKENILDIPLKGVDGKILRTELAKVPEVTAVSMSSSVPGNWEASGAWVQASAEADSLQVFQMFVDQHYIDNLQIRLLAGSGFPEVTSDREEYIIVNETFLKKFGIDTPHDALDKSFIVDHTKSLRVIGVVKDFNFMPLQEAIGSFFFRYDPAQFNFANVSIKSADIHQTLTNLESIWNRISDQKFESRFLDDELEDALVSYRSMIKIFGFLGLLAITISCLGLLAVVISAAESRTREMGIRKILGASVPNLALSLSQGFLKLIAVAIMIATPFTWFLFDKIFLRIFYYRANIGFAEIAFSIALLFVLVLMIIGSQTLKVARINPVETLKYE
jgi:putative ABC transport system permease protein